MDFGLLILRVAVGALLVGHGAQKLFGWFGGYGLAGTGGFFHSLGFRPGKPMAAVAGLSEAGGGPSAAPGPPPPPAAAPPPRAPPRPRPGAPAQGPRGRQRARRG